MKNSSTSLILLALGVISFGACNTNEPRGAAPESPSAEAPLTTAPSPVNPQAAPNPNPQLNPSTETQNSQNNAAGRLNNPVENPSATGSAATTSSISARATLQPLNNSQVRGDVSFTRNDHGIQVVANLSGLPMGEHGFHIHQVGDCSAPDGSSAGEHFNPTGTPHASHDAAQRHVGDLGNIRAAADGLARLEEMDDKIAFEGNASIIGKSVIVHEKPDDFTTQPTGNAGGRLACGVIEFQK